MVNEGVNGMVNLIAQYCLLFRVNVLLAHSLLLKENNSGKAVITFVPNVRFVAHSLILLGLGKQKAVFDPPHTPSQVWLQGMTACFPRSFGI